MKIFIYSLIVLLSQSVLADVSGLTFVAFDVETTTLSEITIPANGTYYFDGTRKQ